MNTRTLPLLVAALAAFALLTACPSKKPKYPACDGDKDCQQGEKCVNKKCLQCAADTDCGEGQMCQDGACKPKEGWCSGDGDCENGQCAQMSGSQGVCTGGQLNDPCVHDMQCDSGICNNPLSSWG